MGTTEIPLRKVLLTEVLVHFPNVLQLLAQALNLKSS